VGAYHRGALTALALLFPALLASYRLTRPLTGAARGCAMAVATLALLTGASLFLGAMGLLANVPLILCSLAGAGLLAARPVGSDPSEPPGTVGFAHALPLLLAVTPLAVNGLLALLSPPTNWDSLAYHLPFVLHWYGGAPLTAIPQLSHYPGQVAYFPGGGELCWLWAAFAWRSDFAFGLINHGFLALGALALYGITRALGVRPSIALATAAIYLTLPIHFLGLLGTANVDLYLTFALLAGLLLALDVRARERCPALAVAAMALLPGIKLSGLWLLPAALWLAWRAGLRLHAIRALCLILCLGGFWYGRNAVLTGNPIYPLPVRILGLELLHPGPLGQMDAFANRAHSPGALRELAEALWGGLGPVSLCLPLALLFQLVRFRHDALHREWAVLTALLGLSWIWLPGTGVLIDYNLRYLLPAVALALVALGVVVEKLSLSDNAVVALGSLCVSQQLLMVAPHTQAPLPWMALAVLALLASASLVRFPLPGIVGLYALGLWAFTTHFRPELRLDYFLKNYHGGLMVPVAHWVEGLPAGRRIAAAGSLPPYYLWGQDFQHKVVQLQEKPDLLVMTRIRDTASFPAEDARLKADPAHFEPLWADPFVHVYRVRAP
jgi:hypothetical protein